MSHDVNTSNAGPTSATVSPAKLRILLACGVIAGQLFVGVAALRALTRDGFGPQPSLPQPAEPGDLGWIQVTNFVVPGLLPTAFAVGMWLVLHPRRVRHLGSDPEGCLRGGARRRWRFVPDPSLASAPGAQGTLDDLRQPRRRLSEALRRSRSRGEVHEMHDLDLRVAAGLCLMAGQANDLPAWSPEDFAAMGAFMEAVNRELVESGESIAARAWLRRCTPGGLAYRAACRSSLTACTPTPRTRWPVTGSWKATASTWRSKLPAGLRAAPHQNMSSPTRMPTYGRSWNPPPKFPSRTRGADKQR
jgi:hypothetical protein